MTDEKKTDPNKEFPYITEVPTTVGLATASDTDIIAKLSTDLKVGYFNEEEKKLWAIQCSEMFEELFRRNFELTGILDEILDERMKDK